MINFDLDLVGWFVQSGNARGDSLNHAAGWRRNARLRNSYTSIKGHVKALGCSPDQQRYK